MKNNKTAIIVFAREPEIGEVKTRLLKTYQADDVTHLYEAFVFDVLLMAQKVNCDKKIIYYSSSHGENPFLQQFSEQFSLEKQTGKDLGARMHRAFSDLKNDGMEKTVIIGTDCLTIGQEDVESAFSGLDKSDCVLGPAEDGGFYLMALKEPHQELFEDVQWGTSEVLDQILRNAKKASLRISLLDVKSDIDTEESLISFIKSEENFKNNLNTRQALDQFFQNLPY